MVNQIRWIARIWVIVAAIVFLAFGLSRGIPTNPDLGTWQEPVQLALLVLVSLGSLIAWRWEAIGATVISFGAIFLGVLATVENDPQVSFLAALVFLIPGVLFWFVWQRKRSFKAVVILAVTMLLLIVSGGYASASVYNYLFGPTHPQSATSAPRVDLVEWVWSGGATPTSITVNTKLADDYDSVRLAVSQSADMSNAVYSGTDVALDQLNQRVVSFTVDGLTPNTHYYYAIEAGGRLDLVRQGQFTSFPSDPASFSFAFASCARTGSNGQVFDAIREAAPLFYMNVGDIHYTYLDTDNPGRFREQLDEVLTRPAQAALYRSLPIGYVWDDHDYGPNDGDRTSPTRDAARQVYQHYVPHYPLAAGEGDVPIYQSFTAGRVRFILTDTRSERDPDASIDDASKSMLGDAQKEWFKQQLLEANGRYPVIVWVNSGPWIDAAGAGKDTWGGFTTERRELADFIAANQIQGLLMVSGDAHALAIDDGTNSDFSTDGTGGFPVFHAAPLDKHAGLKGGPYSEGTSAASGQFGLVSIGDDGGDTITVTLSGQNYKGEEVLRYEYTVEAGTR
jgi:phosphodiesterase/alkaline phosphatase D-like protein